MQDVLAEMATRSVADVAATTHVLCAKYRFGLPGDHPLISRLPNVIHLRARDVARSAQLQLLIQLMRIESDVGGSGSELVVPRLVDSLLVLILRVWLETDPGISAELVRRLARWRYRSCVVAGTHREPHHNWTVQSLADSVGQTPSDVCAPLRAARW